MYDGGGMNYATARFRRSRSIEADHWVRQATLHGRTEEWKKRIFGAVESARRSQSLPA
jgi:hypothetical protein